MKTQSMEAGTCKGNSGKKNPHHDKQIKNLTGQQIKVTPSVQTKRVNVLPENKWQPYIYNFCICNIIVTNYKRTN